MKEAEQARLKAEVAAQLLTKEKTSSKAIEQAKLTIRESKANSDESQKSLYSEIIELQKYLVSNQTDKKFNNDEVKKEAQTKAKSIISKLTWLTKPNSNIPEIFTNMLPKLELSKEDLIAAATEASKIGNWNLTKLYLAKINKTDKKDMSELLFNATASQQKDIVATLLSEGAMFDKEINPTMLSYIETLLNEPSFKDSKEDKLEKIQINQIISSVDNIDAFKINLVNYSNETIKAAYDLAKSSNNYQVLEAFHKVAQNDVGLFTKIKLASPQLDLPFVKTENAIDQDLKKAILNKNWKAVEAMQQQGYAIKTPLDKEIAASLATFKEESSLPILSEFCKANLDEIKQTPKTTIEELKANILAELNTNTPDIEKISESFSRLQRLAEKEGVNNGSISLQDILKGNLTPQIVKNMMDKTEAIAELSKKDNTLSVAAKQYTEGKDSLPAEIFTDALSNPETFDLAIKLLNKQNAEATKLGKTTTSHDQYKELCLPILKKAIEEKNPELLYKFLEQSRNAGAIQSLVKDNLDKILSAYPQGNPEHTNKLYSLLLNETFLEKNNFSKVEVLEEILRTNNAELITGIIDHYGTEEINKLLNKKISKQLEGKLNDNTQKILYLAGIKWDSDAQIESGSDVKITPNIYKDLDNDPKLVLELIKLGEVNINAKDYKGTSLFEHVLANTTLKKELKQNILIEMINQGVDLSVLIKDKQIKIGQIHEVTGISIAVLDKLSNTPGIKGKLFSDQPSDRIFAVEQFLSLEKTTNNKAKPNINFSVTNSNDTMLHIAAYKNDTKLMDRLLEKGADISKVNIHGETPLFWAAKHGKLSTETIKALKPEIVNVTANNGLTALDIAIEQGNQENIIALITAGANKFSEESKKHLTKLENPVLKAMLKSCEDGKITSEKKQEYLMHEVLLLSDKVSPIAVMDVDKNGTSTNIKYFQYVTELAPSLDLSKEVIALMSHRDFKESEHTADLGKYLNKLSGEELKKFNESLANKNEPAVTNYVINAAMKQGMVAKLDMSMIPAERQHDVLEALQTEVKDASRGGSNGVDTGEIVSQIEKLVLSMEDDQLAESINIIIAKNPGLLDKLEDKITDKVVQSMSSDSRKLLVENVLTSDNIRESMETIIKNTPLHELADLYATVAKLDPENNEQNKATILAVKESISARKDEFYKVPGLSTAVHKLATEFKDTSIVDLMEEVRPDLKEKPIASVEKETSKDKSSDKKEEGKKEGVNEFENTRRKGNLQIALGAATFLAGAAITVATIATGGLALIAFGAGAAAFLGAMTAMKGSANRDKATSDEKLFETSKELSETRKEVSGLKTLLEKTIGFFSKEKTEEPSRSATPEQEVAVATSRSSDTEVATPEGRSGSDRSNSPRTTPVVSSEDSRSTSPELSNASFSSGRATPVSNDLLNLDHELKNLADEGAAVADPKVGDAVAPSHSPTPDGRKTPNGPSRY
jgi:ankyrin repeat protein